MTLLFWYLVLLLAGATLVSGLTWIFFVYELGNETPEDWGAWDSVPLGRVFLSLAQGIRSQFLVSLMFPLGYMDRWLFPVKRLAPGPNESGPAYVLVHGLYHNASAWFPFALRLRRRGHTRVRAFSYLSFGTDFFSLLERLDREVDQALTATRGEPVVLVGHSLGGLLIRAYVASEASRGKVRLAVTLGAPHQGSRLAALGLGRLARSLLYQGPLIKDIESRDQTPEIPCLSLSTNTDNFVLPRSALRTDLGGWTEQSLPPQSHVCHLVEGSAFIAAMEFVDQELSSE